MSSFQWRLQQLEERYQEGVAQFKKASTELEKTLSTVRQKYPPLTAKQSAELADHYRSGAAGATLREIQEKVDRGELTWDQVEQGTADPRLTDAYWKSFGNGAALLKAAADGEPIENHLPRYTDNDVEPEGAGRSSSGHERPDDDEYFENQRFLLGGQDR